MQLATFGSYYPPGAGTPEVWAAPRSLATTGGIIVYFLFLRVLRCFSSPRLPPLRADDWPSASRVVPFGDPRIRGHLHLPAAFRSLSRPSSPLGAKASSTYSCLLLVTLINLRKIKSLEDLSIPMLLILLFFGLSQYVKDRYRNNLCVENKGVEPLTSCVQGRRSSQLS